MNHRYIKIGLTLAVLVAAFSGLMWTTLSEGSEYYKLVDEVMKDPAPWENRRMQMHGYVVPGSIMRKPDTFEYRFKIQDKSKNYVVDASYTGIVPDTFKDESEVVLKGKLTNITDPHGQVVRGFETAPDGIMAKCPSKYEPNTTGAPTIDPTKKVG